MEIYVLSVIIKNKLKMRKIILLAFSKKLNMGLMTHEYLLDVNFCFVLMFMHIGSLK